mgnify:CR=1 FL=1
MNTAKPSNIVGPALFGRYLLTSEPESNNSAEAILSNDNDLALELLDFVNATEKSGFNYDKVVIRVSEAIAGRDFLVLLSLLHINSHLSVGCLQGGMSFLASNLKSVLDVSNSGANTASIEQSIERLSNIEVTFSIQDSDNADDSALNFNCGSIIEAFSNGKVNISSDEKKSSDCPRSRVWYVRFGDGLRRIINGTETSKYDWNELLLNRKSSLTIAAKAHLQTIYGAKVYSKRVSTLFRNINSPIDESVWRKCRHYRSRISSQLKRLAKNISNLTPPSPKGSIFLLPRLIIDF